MQKPNQLFESFTSLLDAKGLKCTFERKRIYDEVQKIDSHFDADVLYARFKEQGERISRGTVYRTIPLLLEAGVLQKSAGAGKRDFFEKVSKKGHHDHMICIKCEKIIEFHNNELEDLQHRLGQQYEFKIAFHDHRLFGYCKNCQ